MVTNFLGSFLLLGRPLASSDPPLRRWSFVQCFIDREGSIKSPRDVFPLFLLASSAAAVVVQSSRLVPLVLLSEETTTSSSSLLLFFSFFFFFFSNAEDKGHRPLSMILWFFPGTTAAGITRK